MGSVQFGHIHFETRLSKGDTEWTEEYRTLGLWGDVKVKDVNHVAMGLNGMIWEQHEGRGDQRE